MYTLLTTALTLSITVLPAAADEGSLVSAVELSGYAQYEDRETTVDGDEAPPWRPRSAEVWTEVWVEGTADMTFDLLDFECESDSSFEGMYWGEGEVEAEDGFYLSSVSVADAALESESGCEVDLGGVGISALTEVVVRVGIDATFRECRTYCGAEGRAYAEDRCSVLSGNNALELRCRSDNAAEVKAECMTTCTHEDTYAIVAETRLASDAVSELNDEGFEGHLIGAVRADLVFDHMENSDGDVIEIGD